jgi:AcrR family transcriptional regulator
MTSSRSASATPRDDPTARGVGRPRGEGVDERILAEALEEIARSGLSGFTIAAVARRAGVAKNTIYLRWPKREQLIRAALTQNRNAQRPGYRWDLEADLRLLADEFAQLFASDVALAAYYQLSVSQLNDPEMWAWSMANIIQPSHAIPEEYLREAQSRGLARAEVDAGVVARMLVGAIYTEAILRTPHGHVSDEFRRELVDQLLRLLRPSA